MNLRIWKEIRMLLPVWIPLFLLNLWVFSPFGHFNYDQNYELCLLVFCSSLALLGVYSFALENHYRTWTFTLTQPVSRLQIWNEKMRVLTLAVLSVLAPMCVNVINADRLLAIGAGLGAALIFLALVRRISTGLMQRMPSPWLAALVSGSLLLALGAVLLALAISLGGNGPLLAMGMVACLGIVASLGVPGSGAFFVLLVRNPVAGMFLIIGMPALLLTVFGLYVEPYILSRWGLFSPNTDLIFPVGVLMLAYALAMYHLGLAKFLRQPMIEASATGWYWPRLSQDRLLGVLHSHVGSRLGAGILAKELRLQGVSLLLAGGFAIYACLYIWFVSLSGWRMAMERNIVEAIFEVPFFTCLVLLPILIGATAAAEDRHLGMLEWHLTLPVSKLRQWWIKVGTALGLFLLVGVVLLWSLRWLVLKSSMVEIAPMGWSDVTGFFFVQLFLLSLALYASAYARNTFEAALLCVVLVTLFSFLVFQADSLKWTSESFIPLRLANVEWLRQIAMSPDLAINLFNAVLALIVLGHVVLMLILATAHFREVKMRFKRLAGHLLVMTGCFALGMLFMSNLKDVLLR